MSELRELFSKSRKSTKFKDSLGLFGGKRSREIGGDSTPTRSLSSTTEVSALSSENSLASYFPDGVKTWYDCDEAVVDICFVHGLTGNRDSTWTAHGRDTAWPKELLPSKINNARILTYGYDAYVVLKSVTSSNRLIDHATNLLNDLSTDRDSNNASDRPLVFVAHSLGGIVCQKAILLSRNNPEPHLQSVFNHTEGIIFMGTPHRGSWMADWAKIPATALGFIKSTNKALLEILETDSQILEDTRLNFSAMIRELSKSSKPVQVTCFCEELPLGGVGMVVSKYSATIEGYNTLSIHANHCDMVRFSSADENGFKGVLGVLKRWLNSFVKSQFSTELSGLEIAASGRIQNGSNRELKKLLSYHPSPKRDESDYTQVERGKRARKFLSALYTCPYEDRKERNRDRVPGTCGWFTNHSLFRNWNENQGSNLLWVSADPGCGKSVLAKYLVDHFLPNTNERTTCYFFFKDDFTDQKVAANAICAILRQIFLAKPHLLCDSILDRFDTDGEKFTQSFLGLWDTLINVVADSSAGEIVCVLDALDECQESDRSQLIHAVKKLSLDRPNKLSLKFLLTSRPYDHIQHVFRELENHMPIIHIGGENEVEVAKISQEIDLVIQSMVEEICQQRSLKPDERTFLQEQLMLIPNRTYLWVTLTLHVIKRTSGFTKGNVHKAIRQIPQTVDDAYSRILDRSSDTEKARKILHIVTAAKAPLSLEEMSLMMALEEDQRTYDEVMQEIEPEERFRVTLRNICGLFVVVVDGKIYLLHQTAKEFLIQDRSSRLLHSPSCLNSQCNSSKWKHSLRPEESNRILAERCVWYLTLVPGGTFFSPLLFYSAEHWAAHFREAGIRSEEPIALLTQRLCDTFWNRHMGLRLRFYRLPKHTSPLGIASFFGLEAVVKLYLEDDKVDVNSKNERGCTPLSLAIGSGHETMIKLLLETEGVDVNSKNENGWTSLLIAATMGHETVIKLLLQIERVDVNSKDKKGYTSLMIAALRGNERVVKLLLETESVDVNSKDENGWTSLLIAAMNGHQTVVKLLLETESVDVNVKDIYGRTPLELAILKKHEAVAKLLYETGKVESTLT